MRYVRTMGIEADQWEDSMTAGEDIPFSERMVSMCLEDRLAERESCSLLGGDAFKEP